MTQTFDLNKMGLAPMNEIEMQEVDGGFFGIFEYFWHIGAPHPYGVEYFA